MKTFTGPKITAINENFRKQRQKSLSELSKAMIDTPIIKIINSFNKLDYCFTLQCCYGHFLFNRQVDTTNLDPLPATDTKSPVEYRIAYLAFCIENSDSGRRLLEDLKKVAVHDPENIQFGCAEWFWKRQVNSYVLQVEPYRFRYEDKVMLQYPEALHIEKIRNEFFDLLEQLLNNIVNDN